MAGAHREEKLVCPLHENIEMGQQLFRLTGRKKVVRRFYASEGRECHGGCVNQGPRVVDEIRPRCG